MTLGQDIHTAIRKARELAGDALAPVVVLAPTRANAQLLQRTYASAQPYIRVWFESGAGLVDSIAQQLRPHDGQRVAPAGWLETTLMRGLRDEALLDRLGEFGGTLAQPAWLKTIAATLRELNSAGVTAADVAAVAGDSALYTARVVMELTRYVEAQARQDDVVLPGWLTRDALAQAKTNAARWADLPAHLRDAALVVVGDGSLSYLQSELLTSYVSDRASVRLDIMPFAQLPPAPNGLRAALAPDVAVIEAAPVAATTTDNAATARLQTRLYAPGPPPPASGPATDDSLTWVAAADPVVAVREALRRVVTALQSGIALDRCAIVLPDAETADALGDALARLDLPATWLVGPPLSRIPEARWLRVALAIAAGQETVSNWYALLRHPGMLNRGRLRSTHPDPIDIHGASRWRGLFASTRARNGTDAIVAGLRRAAEREQEREAEAAADVTSEPHTVIESRALRSLASVIEALQAELSALRQVTSLAGHGARLTTLLRYLAPTAGRSQLARLLASWGASEIGAPISLHDALVLYTDATDATQVLSGKLSDKALRVLPPMACLGAEFDVVCCVGLADGRFPRQRRPAPLLTDELIAALNQRANATRLLGSDALVDVERRRFAAMIASVRATAWLAYPLADMLKARPMVPSQLLLDALSELLGTRATYAALSELAVPAGLRGDTVSGVPLNPAEHLRNLAAKSRTADPTALASFLAEPTVKRILQLYRGIDRAYAPAPGQAPALDAYAGRVTATLEHVADGASPCEAKHLASLLTNPGAYAARRLLGAWRPDRLDWDADPVLPTAVADWALTALNRVLAADNTTLGPTLPDAAAPHLAELTAELTADAPDLSDRAALAASLSAARLAELAAETGENALVQGQRATLDGTRITASDDGDALSWELTGASGYTGAGDLTDFVRDDVKKAGPRRTQAYVQRLLEARALNARDGTSLKAAIAGLDGQRFTGSRSAPPDIPALLEAAALRIEQGLWPLGGSSLALHSEVAVDADSLRALAASPTANAQGDAQ